MKMRKKQREFTNRELDINTIKKDYEKIILKIGVHSGSTIIVTLNGRLDYFGNSVKIKQPFFCKFHLKQDDLSTPVNTVYHFAIDRFVRSTV